jgi:hypothetical protein
VTGSGTVPSSGTVPGTGTARVLAAIRIVNGAVALTAPGVFTSQMHATAADESPRYPFRLFGIRALVNGAELLWPEASLRRLPEITVLVHASDLASACIAGLRHEVSPRFARRTVLLSGINTGLAVATWVLARRGGPRPS